MYDVNPRYALRAGLAGLGSALVGGVVIHFIPGFGLIMQLLVGAFYGYAVSGAVSAATNRKRGTMLCWITVAAILIGYPLSRVAFVALALAQQGAGMRFGRALAAAFSADLGTLLFLVVAAVVAYQRLR